MKEGGRVAHGLHKLGMLGISSFVHQGRCFGYLIEQEQVVDFLTFRIH
jgi:hypothetical protein